MLVKNHELQQHSSHLALHCYLTAFQKLTAVDSGHNVNFYNWGIHLTEVLVAVCLQLSKT